MLCEAWTRSRPWMYHFLSQGEADHVCTGISALFLQWGLIFLVFLL